MSDDLVKRLRDLLHARGCQGRALRGTGEGAEGG